MGYNIEISFNILKQSSIIETQNYVFEMATQSNCNSYYIDYEMEHNHDYKRNHCIITINFDDINSIKIIDFIKKIRLWRDYYIEAIYNDDTNECIYASKTYLIQNTNQEKKEEKKEKKENKENKEKQYSDIENSILEILKKQK